MASLAYRRAVMRRDDFIIPPPPTFHKVVLLCEECRTAKKTMTVSNNYPTEAMLFVCAPCNTAIAAQWRKEREER